MHEDIRAQFMLTLIYMLFKNYQPKAQKNIYVEVAFNLNNVFFSYSIIQAPQ